MNLQEKLKENTTVLINSFSTLNQAAIEFKPAENVWSVLECVEHIFLIDRAVAKGIATPPPAEKAENTKTELFGEGKLNHLLVTKRIEYKAVAPDFSIPKGRFKTSTEAIEAINNVMNETIDFLNRNDVTQDTHTTVHMRLGDMTKTDWIHFLIAHTNRHIVQIEETKKVVS
jgi:uncharacterized damage-inducible protein DinB